MAYLGNAPARSFISFERQVFTIVNSQTAYTLDHSVNNENDIRLVINNIVQEPGSGKAYTASGTTLTLSAALVNGTDEMYCVFLGRAVATNKPGAGSVGTSQLASEAVTNAKVASSIITGQTAETSIATDDLILLSDTSASGALKKMTRANFVSGIGGTNTPAFEAKITTEQNPTGATNVKINFDNEIFDTANAYSTTDKRFTVPSGQAGKYFIYSSTNMGSSANSGFNTGDLKIYKNGSDQNARGHFNTNNDGNGRYYQFSIFNIFDLSVGDYIEMYCYINQTATTEVRVAESRFGGFKIIE